MDDYLHHRLKAERAKVLGQPEPEPEKRPHRAPKYIETVDGDLFQIVGEEQLYTDPCKALRRLSKLQGAVIIRLSDKKVIARGPDGWVPKPPKEYP